jgi:hypothetical protein
MGQLVQNMKAVNTVLKHFGCVVYQHLPVWKFLDTVPLVWVLNTYDVLLITFCDSQVFMWMRKVFFGILNLLEVQFTNVPTLITTIVPFIWSSGHKPLYFDMYTNTNNNNMMMMMIMIKIKKKGEKKENNKTNLSYSLQVLTLLFIS